MKENIIKIIVFFSILIIILLVLSYIFIPKNNSEEYGIKEQQAMGILGEKENSIDVIIYGDSETIASTMPMKLWDDYGYATYVCGTSGQTLPDTCKIVYETLKKQKPKILILETDNIYNPTKITVPLARILNIALPVTEYHNRWKSLRKEDFFGKIKYTNTDLNKGYYYVGRVLPCDDSSYMEYTMEKEEIPTSSKLYIKLLNEYCKSNDILFAMMSVPSVKHWNYAKHNAIKEFTEEENIEFLDLNELKDIIGIDWTKETGDEGDHVNYWGALKVTAYFGKWLQEKNILQNHKEDEEYKKWNIDLKKYNEQFN